MKKLWYLAASALLALPLHMAHAQDVVVAHVGPMSGPLAGNGIANYEGAKAYFDQVNAQGGINGQKIRLVREDDQYKADETIRLVQEVAKRDRPAAFINLLGSANVTAMFKDKTFDKVANAFGRVVDLSTNRELARYDISESGSYTGLILASLKRSGGEWVYKAIGERAAGVHVQQLVDQSRRLI